MKLDNPFPTHKRELFRDLQYKCWECGQNGQNRGGTELHHIRGRISSSVFNGAVLCGVCHRVVGHSFKEEQKYLQKTAPIIFRAVQLEEYVLDEDDINFLNENKQFYL